MAIAFWRTCKGSGVYDKSGKREISKEGWPRYKFKGADGRWRGPFTAVGCRTLKEALDYANERELKARRQRHGLEPMHRPPDVTFGDLLEAWVKQVLARRESDSKHAFVAMVRLHLDGLLGFVLNDQTLAAFADRVDELFLKLKEEGYAASTRLKLKAAISGVFREASNPRRRRWHFDNPANWIGKIKKQSVPQESLLVQEARSILEAFDEPRAGAPWRWASVVDFWTGLRPGEVYGLWKDDVDLVNQVITVRRSWEKPWPKDKDPRLVPVPPEALECLKDAMDASPNHLVFPDPDGKVFKSSLRFRLADLTRKAAVKAGVVAGWTHRCPPCAKKASAKKVVEWRHADAERRECPHCGRVLKAKAIERRIGSYIWRHTYVTLLLGGGVDPLAVSRLVGHEEISTTKGYDHRQLALLRERAQLVLGCASRVGVDQ